VRDPAILERSPDDSGQDALTVDAVAEDQIRLCLARGEAREAATMTIRTYGPSILSYLRSVLRDEDIAEPWPPPTAQRPALRGAALVDDQRRPRARRRRVLVCQGLER
jgi:hypothetical protein